MVLRPKVFWYAILRRLFIHGGESMKQLILFGALVAATAMASANEYVGDVRLPAYDEINAFSKQEQTLELRSCRNGYKIDQIRLVAHHDLTIDSVTVVYGNGNTHDMRFRRNYIAGGRTRWKDIHRNGRSKCVREIIINGESSDSVRGALVGVRARTSAGGNGGGGNDFQPGAVTFYREDATCGAFFIPINKHYNIPYDERPRRQRRLCERHGEMKSVKYALIQGKCVSIRKENMETACPKVMHNQEDYYNGSR